MAYKQSPKQHDKEAVTSNQVVYMISCQAFAPTTNDHIWSFNQFTATNFVSMVAKSSDLADKTSGANLQADGHVEVPTQSAMDLWEPEEEDSSPSHSLSWSPAQRPPSGQPNMKYCLEI